MHLQIIVRKLGRNSPNILSISRLITVPFIPIIFHQGRPGLAFWLLFFAFATDVLDGAIAVRFNLLSRLGRYLDFVADGVFFATCLITLYLADKVSLSEAIVVAFFVVTVHLVRLVLSDRSIIRRALCLVTPLGFFLSGFMTAVLLVYRSVGDSKVLLALAWFLAALTIALFLYFKRNRLRFWLRGGISIIGR